MGEPLTASKQQKTHSKPPDFPLSTSNVISIQLYHHGVFILRLTQRWLSRAGTGRGLFHGHRGTAHTMWEIILKAEFWEITENSFKWEMIFFGQIFHLLLFFIWTHWLINCQSVGWLVGRFVGWSVGWSVGQLVGWLVGWPVSWLVILSIFILYLDSLTYQQLVSQSVGWLVGWSVGQSVGESVSWLVGWLVGCLVSWLVILFIFYSLSGFTDLSIVGPLVRRSTGWLVGLSVCQLVDQFVGCLVGWLVG